MPTPRATSAPASVTGLPPSRTTRPVTSPAAPARAPAAAPSAAEPPTPRAPAPPGPRVGPGRLRADHQVVGSLGGTTLQRHLPRLHRLRSPAGPTVAQRRGAGAGPH